MKNHSAKLNKKPTRYRTPSLFKAQVRPSTQLKIKPQQQKTNNDWYNQLGS
jgi:hypothetical protein